MTGKAAWTAWVGLVGVALVWAGGARGGEAVREKNAKPQAAGAARTQTTAPAKPQAATDPAVVKILRDLEKAGQKYGTIRADIDYNVRMRTLGDSEDRTGWVAYRKSDEKTPAHFRVTFETLKQGAGKKLRDVVDYAFDGQWLTVAKHRIKTMTLYQLAAEGQRIEPLRIGKGPFPLPFGQKADDVLKYFTATRRRSFGTDPKNSTGIRLTVRPERAKEMSVQRLDMWIDRTTHLPVKLKSRDKSRNDTTVTFKNIQTNKAVPASVFRIPRKLGWETIRRPLEAGRVAAP